MDEARSVRKRRRVLVATLVTAGLIAAACSKDDTVGDDSTAATSGPSGTTAASSGPSGTTAPPGASTSAPSDTTTGGSGGSDSTSATTAEPAATTVPPLDTLAPPEGDPVRGGRLVVAGEAEVGAPWAPASVQCDSYCHMRIRTFIEPLFGLNADLEVVPYLGTSIEPNRDFTVWTITVREGVEFSDGTPLNADAVIDNLNRTASGLLVSGALKDLAKNKDGTLVTEKQDEYTFTLATGKDGNPDDPLPWPGLPFFLTGQPGFVASPTWLAAIDDGSAQATDGIGTGPFIISDYRPGDRMTVVRNEDYWRQDDAGEALPYLDEIEFRVIVDSQVRGQALESGDVDLISTSDGSVVSQFVDNDDFQLLQQDRYTETNYIMLHLTKPQLKSREVRCALAQGFDRQELSDLITNGFNDVANGPFSPGQDGYLEDNGYPDYDPDAAAAAIEAYEAENGPVTLSISTTPTGTNKAQADFLQQAWTQIGVDVTQSPVEQSVLITNALLGSPDFEAFGWRNHAGTRADTQYFWWHSRAANGLGAPAEDGAPALNFGRLDDPEIDRLLEMARSESDPEVAKGYAQDINRRFGKECWILPTTYTSWGVVMQPSVQNIGRDPLPDSDGFLLDGAGFSGQVWLTAAFIAE